MFLVLFVTFCKVDFHKLRPVAWHWWIGLFQVLTVGAIMALIICFNLTGENLILAEAVLTCIICPCASAAAVVTQKLGGNLEEMTTYTFISNFITALLIPICFPMIDKAANIHFFEAFALILYKVFTVLVAPMILAYIVKHYAKNICQRIISIKDLSYYLCRYKHYIPPHYTLKFIGTVSVPIWMRTSHRLTIQPNSQRWAGIRPKEHSLCHMDCLYLPISIIVCWSRLLHSMAEYHKQLGDMGSTENS